MARVCTTPRTTCAACDDPLTSLDGGSDHCLLCRQALAKGRTSWGLRMAFVRKRRRAQGIGRVLPADPFQGFRGE